MTDKIIPDKNLINSNNGLYDESFHENLSLCGGVFSFP